MPQRSPFNNNASFPQLKSLHKVISADSAVFPIFLHVGYFSLVLMLSLMLNLQALHRPPRFS